MISAVPALGSATPVGPLPKGPSSTVHLTVGKSHTVRLPKVTTAGRVWRIARAFNAKVVTETREGETNGQVWVTFRGVGAGSTKVVFAQTKGETSHAFAARTFRFIVGR